MTSKAQIRLHSISESITGQISKKAQWNFIIESNVDNWTVIWKNSSLSRIDCSTGKYKISVSKIDRLIYNMSLEIRDIMWVDKGYYPLVISIENTNISAKSFLYLDVEGNFLAFRWNSSITV